jgi:hypothetical protein
VQLDHRMNHSTKNEMNECDLKQIPLVRSDVRALIAHYQCHVNGKKNALTPHYVMLPLLFLDVVVAIISMMCHID